eukprot:183479_1
MASKEEENAGLRAAIQYANTMTSKERVSADSNTILCNYVYPYDSLNDSLDGTPVFMLRSYSLDAFGYTFQDVAQRLIEILVNYQEWLTLSLNLKQSGTISLIEAMYNCKGKPQDAMVKLQNDFNIFIKQQNQQIINEDEAMYDELTTISDKINTILTQRFQHQSNNCSCVERVYRDRAQDGMVTTEALEIAIQQILDSYHCVFVHLYDAKDVISDKLSGSGDNLNESPSINQTSSLMSHSHSNINRNKFNTYTTYDTGIRFYYWIYYKHNQLCMDKYQDRVTDPGNAGDYRFCDWYIVADASNLKEEILSFGDEQGSHISNSSYDSEYQKVCIYLKSEDGRQMYCQTNMWEIKYGVKKGDVAKQEHILAIRFYCNFSKATEQLIRSFLKQGKQTDDEVKQRHKKCALWSQYLRECVEAFGTRLQNNRSGVPGEYYHGITEKFLFRKTILRFNLPMSTTIERNMAFQFVSGRDNGDGLILKLKPHWGDYGGYIRAMNCCAFSDYQWECEYLFIGGLEPLVINNIFEANSVKSYASELQSMNNIYQIFEGMACKFKIKPKLIAQFIDNRLNTGRESGDYMSRVFDFYCDNLKQLTMRLSLMDKSYKSVANIFMDTYGGNVLKLMKIIQLFPNCERITLCDGYNYQLIPSGIEYEHTILAVIEHCLEYVNKSDHKLERIALECPDGIEEPFLNQCKQTIDAIGWCCAHRAYDKNDTDEKSSYEQELKDFNYVISKKSN